MTSQEKYNALVAELTALEATCGCDYLTDENVDAENVMEGKESSFYGTEGFWRDMVFAAQMAAGSRAEEAGIDLNAAAGRTIY